MVRRITRTPPYKDFLQAALHRRFLSIALVLIITAYVEAVLLAPWTSYLWAWFPVGPTGLRTSFLLLSGIWVLFLRIGQYHVGFRTSTSCLNGLIHNTLKMQTAEVFFAYFVSTAFFGPVFLATRSSSAQMNLIQHLGGDRARINEKPLFLGSYLFLIALAQSIFHLWRDEDRMVFSVDKNGRKKLHSDDAIFRQITARIPALIIQTTSASIIMVLVNTLVYHAVLRSFIWGWALTFTRPFYNLPRTSMVPSAWPLTLTTIIQCSYSGFLLLFMWNLSNVCFSNLIVREPLKNGKPLTSESKDPNGSLLNGLKSKKLSAKSFALWELSLIARSFPERRRAIFEDIERQDGPMWSQVCLICVNILKSIDTRLDACNAPAVPPPVPATTAAASSNNYEYRRRAYPPIRDNSIYQPHVKPATMRSELERAIGHVITTGSQTSTGISPIAKKTLKQARDRLISREHQEALAHEHVGSWFKRIALAVLENDFIGPFFRESFRNRFNAVVFGAPYAEISMYLNAASALSALSVASLSEDKLGKVYMDVGNLVKTFTGIILNIEHSKTTFPLHWTDVKGVRNTPEVDVVLAEMKSGLQEILGEFEIYASDLRLTPADVRLAKEACAEKDALGQAI
ncbi:hypothetical protein TD95_004855 [Thielaviopsis punctulata]|uniref:Nucleoporin NDC1 n=1 Tax=Thielaviopsis punctulata TaxID=72032 RepID=A0A0F4ZBV0_9PEZI|nr:hypothetical protein TD95_004855 [Thielaviopsis punctulata]